MFQDLLDRIEFLPVDKSELAQTFSLDVEGHKVTLEEYIQGYTAGRVLATRRGTAGAAPAQNTAQVKPVRDLSEVEMDQLVQDYVDSIPQGETLVIMGEGPFTVDQLRQEVRRRTAVGQRLANIVRRYHMFMEEAVKQG